MSGPKPPGQVPASSAILVRLQPNEYLSIARMASEQGRSLGSFVRNLLRQLVLGSGV